MLTEERFTRILSILESMGSVTVQQLMTELDASESTIRRDLNTLDANGQLIKVHGGAILKNTSYSTEDDEVMQRRERNKGAKEKIAKYAAGLIEPGDFVYIDAGTTTDLMIDYGQTGSVCDKCDHTCKKTCAERLYGIYSWRRVQDGDRGNRWRGSCFFG